MDRLEAEKAAKEARAEVGRADRSPKRTEAALRFLQEIAYVESHRRESQHRTERDERGKQA